MKRLILLGAVALGFAVALMTGVSAQTNPFFIVQNPQGVHITAGTQFPSAATIGASPADGALHIDMNLGVANPVLNIYNVSTTAWVPISAISGAGQIPTTLATNAVGVVNSIWGGTNQLIFEGGAADTGEFILTWTNSTTDVTLTVPADNATWAGTGSPMISTLLTNAPDAASSVTGGTNQLIFEATTVDGNEAIITAADTVLGDVTLTIPIDNAQWDGAGTFVLSDLITNAPDEANGVWFEANTLVFEGAQDGFETRITPTSVGQDLAWTLPDTGAATGAIMFSTLATNNVDIANSIWFTSNTLNFGGLTGGDGFEHQITPEDPAADRVITLADYDAASAFVHSTLVTNAPDANNSIWFESNLIRFEGATGGDAFETVLQTMDPTVGVDTYQFSDNAAAAATYNIMFSLLGTNAIDVAHSVWFGGTAADILIYEGATGGNAFELMLSGFDPTADRTMYIPDANDAVASMVYTTVDANDVGANDSVYFGQGTLVWEGNTGDGVNVHTLALMYDPGAARTIAMGDMGEAAASLVYSLVDNMDVDDANSVWFNAAGGLTFEGATGANLFEIIIAVDDSTVGVDTYRLADQAAVADTYSIMWSLLDTNALDVAGSVWFDANTLVFEGATGGNAFEIEIEAADSTVAIDTYLLPDRALAAANYGVHASPEAELASRDFMYPTAMVQVASAPMTADANDDMYCYRLYMPQRITVGNFAVLPEGAPAALDIIGAAIYYDNAAGDGAQVTEGTGDGTGGAGSVENIDVTDVTLNPGMYRFCACTDDATNVQLAAMAISDADWNLLDAVGVITYGVAANTCNAGDPPATTGALTADNEEPFMFKLN